MKEFQCNTKGSSRNCPVEEVYDSQCLPCRQCDLQDQIVHVTRDKDIISRCYECKIVCGGWEDEIEHFLEAVRV